MRDEIFSWWGLKKKKGLWYQVFYLLLNCFLCLAGVHPLPHPMLANPVVMNVGFFSVHCTWVNIGWKSDNSSKLLVAAVRLCGCVCMLPSVKRMHRWGEQEAGQVMGAGAAKHFMSPLKRETWSFRAQMYHMAVWTGKPWKMKWVVSQEAAGQISLHNLSCTISCCAEL